jgi:aldehyde dehydrogenase (NAD+)
MTIGGASATAPLTFPVVNPATLETVAGAPNCTGGLLDAAVTAAREAQPAWAAQPVAERQRFLGAVADVVDANLPALARLVTIEQGKPLPVAEAEVAGLSYWLRETATMELPEEVNQDDGKRRSITRHVPLGVVAAITPWNYPIGQLSFKLGPALLAGNTVVVKPSEFTPLATLKLGELLRETLPAGVLNVISGGGGLGSCVTGHPGFDKISFTGSTRTGREVMASAAASLTRVTLELGGNDPAIVLADVDVDRLAEQLFWAAFSNSGQICLATKRLYIHADVYDQMAQALAARAKSARVGNGLDEGVQLGPVSTRRQYETVVDLLRDAQANGYTFLAGGLPAEQAGYFIEPTIVGNPPEAARVVQEEQFGPVLPLLKFDDIDEVVDRANASNYGLGASVWSADPARALAVGERLQAGTVWINEVMHLSPLVPFGGLKQSGIGIESGVAGLLDFTQPQTITVKR